MLKHRRRVSSLKLLCKLRLTEFKTQDELTQIKLRKDSSDC